MSTSFVHAVIDIALTEACVSGERRSIALHSSAVIEQTARTWVPTTRVGNKQINQIKSARFSLVTTFVGLVLPSFGEFDLFDLFVTNSAYHHATKSFPEYLKC